MWWWVVDQPITDHISGPSFDFTFTIGRELDNLWLRGRSPLSWVMNYQTLNMN